MKDNITSKWARWDLNHITQHT